MKPPGRGLEQTPGEQTAPEPCSIGSMPIVDEIAAFYDAHPYPPPVDDLEASLTGWDEMRRRVEHFRHWPSVPYREDRTILVAGCGTSQAARWAARHPGASVLGIDVSLSSLEATERLARQHSLDNLELRQLPIEEVGSIGHSFDQVVCTGVLHHLADPGRGLKALHEALAPGGALQLMVYARYGRFGLSLLREFSQMLGVGTSAREVEDLVQTLRELPAGHPMSHVLRETADFRDRDAIADALLNPRETSYTVPELLDLIGDAGLRFARWVRQAPYHPQCGIMRELPHAERIAPLSAADQFAAMELFRGTIARHSLIAHRGDSPLPVGIDWDGRVSSGYVPMVPRTVVVVEDRLPPGMAAAVINRAHTDRDLVCFLTAEERAVFGAIDGETPLGEIVGATPQLIERLWMHDLVMVDATGSPA